MTPEQLLIKIQEWDSEYPPPDKNDTAKYSHIYAVLKYLSEGEWKTFLPAEHSDHNSRYIERLAAWVGSTKDEEEQKVLLEYALHISFFSHDDFTALYQAAFEREAAQWVVQTMETGLHSADDCKRLRDAVKRELHGHTWFCPVTESMDINSFCKVNNLTGIRYHPKFEDLCMLGNANSDSDQNAETIEAFMNDPTTKQQNKVGQQKRLVLLEDFVGTGGQCKSALEWAIKSLKCPILFIPLIITKEGGEHLESLARSSDNRLQIRPVVTVARTDLVGPKSEGNMWPFASALENAVSKHYDVGWKNDMVDEFGFKNTGCSVVLHRNAPNNSVSLIHCTSKINGWQALFPRVPKD